MVRFLIRSQIFFVCPTLVARRKTSSSIDYFFWKSRSHTLLLVFQLKTQFFGFCESVVVLFTIQGTIFIVVQNQWDKFMLKINSCSISLALCNWIFFLGNVLFLFIIVWPIMEMVTLHSIHYTMSLPITSWNEHQLVIFSFCRRIVHLLSLF